MTFSNDIVIKTALETLKIEWETIQGLEASIDASFVEVVRLMYECKGRIIVTGVGKSAIVGKKIVATLNSTGTPSIFLHAADAIHGDLGMVQSNDLVLCISKSGDTAEVKVLVPIVKHLGSTLVAMVSNSQSFLAYQAHYILYTPVPKEADPNNLAPTASTIAQMAMGDTIAMALLALRGFSANDFALFHPGGSLGKQLYLRVSDLFVLHERPAVSLEATIRETIIEITSKRLGCTVVTDELGRVCGIITDGDLRRMLERESDITPLRAKDIMTHYPRHISKDALAVVALEKMRTHSITQLVVMEEEKYIGIVHLHDLLKEGIV